MDVLVAGGHGQIGRRLLRLLAQRGHTARGLIRNVAHVGDLEADGAHPVLCDLEHDDVRPHVGGAEAIVFTAGAGPGSGPERKRTVDLGGALKCIEAAQELGVDRFLMVSVMGTRDLEHAGPMRPYLEAKADADAALETSGLDWTIVRPGRLTDEPGHRHRRPRAGAGAPRGDPARRRRARPLPLPGAENTVRAQFDLLSGPVPADVAVRSVEPARAGGGMIALLLAAPPRGPRSAQVPAGPAGDAFYTPPATLPAGHGTPIWQRKLTGAAVLKSAKRNRLLLYRSTATNGSAIAVSGTVAIPKGTAPKGGWPVISWAHGTTGIADACAPSRSDAFGGYDHALLNRWLKAGYAVVRTDYEGLGTPGDHPYLIGVSEGRSVLDMVRAARKLDSNIGKRVVIAGHSQGGHAALWAASLQRKWTPELNAPRHRRVRARRATSATRPRCCAR